MRSSYYHLLGQIVVAIESCEQNSSLAAALHKAGFGEGQLSLGRKLAQTGQELISRKALEAFEDRIYEHNMHYSAGEVEMWQSTVSFLLKKSLDDPALIAKTLGTSIHAADHTVTIVAQALRTLAVLRTDPRVYEALGGKISVHDQLNRGFAMLGKIFSNGDIILRPSSAGRAENPIFAELTAQRSAMVDWVTQLGAAAAKLKDDPLMLGELGYIPEGVGLPQGGNAFNVPLHERGQRAELPELDNLKPDPGWSIGRQGRNRENWGPGFIEPTFE